jgi:hypothetical protein
VPWGPADLDSLLRAGDKSQSKLSFDRQAVQNRKGQKSKEEKQTQKKWVSIPGYAIEEENISWFSSMREKGRKGKDLRFGGHLGFVGSG